MHPKSILSTAGYTWHGWDGVGGIGGGAEAIEILCRSLIHVFVLLNTSSVEAYFLKKSISRKRLFMKSQFSEIELHEKPISRT